MIATGLLLFVLPEINFDVQSQIASWDWNICTFTIKCKPSIVVITLPVPYGAIPRNGWTANPRQLWATHQSRRSGISGCQYSFARQQIGRLREVSPKILEVPKLKILTYVSCITYVREKPPPKNSLVRFRIPPFLVPEILSH